MGKKSRPGSNPAEEGKAPVRLDGIPMALMEVPIEKLAPHPKNPRKISDAGYAKLKKSLKQFPEMLYKRPLVVVTAGDGYLVLGGNQRLKALQEMGVEQVPVMLADELTEEQREEFIVKDNVSLGEFDWDALEDGWNKSDLVDWGVDFPAITKPKKGLTDPDAVPETPKVPVTRPGDIWALGEHRIICGDSTDSATWGKLMKRDRASMVFTDPPYGVSYKAASGEFDVIKGDDMRRDELYGMLMSAFKCMVGNASNNAAFYIWHASSARNDFAQAMTAAGLVERQYLIWAKTGLVLGHADYQWSHEPCFYAAIDGNTPAFYGGRAEGTTWRVAEVSKDQTATILGNGVLVLSGTGKMLYIQPKPPKNKKVREIRLTPTVTSLRLSDATGEADLWEVGRDRGYVHPTQKPVELATRAIHNSSQPGEVVVDGFSGSGTTIIACEQSGRKCRAIELAPEYVDVAVKRWQDFTGKEAILMATGETFAQHAEAQPASV